MSGPEKLPSGGTQVPASAHESLLAAGEQLSSLKGSAYAVVRNRGDRRSVTGASYPVAGEQVNGFDAFLVEGHLGAHRPIPRRSPAVATPVASSPTVTATASFRHTQTGHRAEMSQRHRLDGLGCSGSRSNGLADRQI